MHAASPPYSVDEFMVCERGAPSVDGGPMTVRRARTVEAGARGEGMPYRIDRDRVRACRGPGRRAPIAGASVLVFGLGLLWCGPANAEEWRVFGARYQGMGGAGVAIAEGAAAAHWNPAALAFEPRLFEIEIPLGVSASTEGDLLENAARLDDFIDRTGFDDTLDKIRDGEQLSDAELGDTVRLVTDILPAFERRGQGIVARADAGLTLRSGQWVITSRATALAGGDPIVDTVNLGFASGLDVRLASLVGPGADRSAEFANPGSQSLADLVAAGPAGLTQAQAEELVLQAERAGVDTSSPSVRSIVSRLSSGSAVDAVNQTGATITGLYTKEIGVASGVKLTDRLALGANIRYVHGTTIAKTIRVDSDESNSIGTENRRRTRSMVIDVGFLYELSSGTRIGISGRNLNEPKFKSRGARPFVLKPQIRAGAAVELSPYWHIAVDLDLTENGAETIGGFESRQLAIGTEYRFHLIERSVALRAGVHRNLASGPNREVAVTLGLGLQSGSFQFDLAYSSALERRRFEVIEKHIPRRVDIAATLRYVREF
jgi:hypothetical protein